MSVCVWTISCVSTNADDLNRPANADDRDIPVIDAPERQDAYWMKSYEMREKMVQDRHRPLYHFAPPEGRWNDINGAVFHKGRYHLGYLQKIANADEQRDFSSWQHISSRDLLHWRYHKASLREPLEGHNGEYFNSGDLIRGAEVPTFITNMPARGIVVYQSHDDDLDDWRPISSQPVIAVGPGKLAEDKRSPKYPESMIFDPSGWKEGDTWYALVGSKNYRAGYEGDSTSLFKSKDLTNWDYVGPFYKSNRKWTTEDDDCACSSFFPFGNQHMLLMHSHRPYYKAQYYLGRYENEQFFPQTFGQLSWLGSMLSGPETLIDDRGRRIFWGWIADAREKGVDRGWQSIMTLPWHLAPEENGTLRIKPVEELQSLRYDARRHADVTLREQDELIVEGFDGEATEIQLQIKPGSAKRFGIKLLCSPDGEEETVVTYNRRKQQFEVNFENASSENLIYRCGPTTLRKGNLKQIVPFALKDDESLDLDIFIDRSVTEIFVNSRICIVQRVYPTRKDSTQFKLFTKGGSVDFSGLRKWTMDATNPW